MLKRNSQPISVMLVDDDPDCRLLLRDALEDCVVDCSIHEFRSGEELLDFLMSRSKGSDTMQPGLIFLDMEMPGGIDGLETLGRIRARSEFREIPVVMMTGVCGEDQMKRAAQLGANSYTVKPADAERFLRSARTSASYWLSIHQYPQHHISAEVCRR